METYSANSSLLQIQEHLNKLEQQRLSPRATLSSEARRRKTDREEETGHRQPFALDADRILHSRAYTRYIDKTQVFCLIANDHITHRVLHVQLVSRIARTIGRFLHLNEDLIEAIALGHDIGHPPFGHDGEHFLAELCRENGLPSFQHNIQSVRFLDRLERKGKGWNLSMQTLDGILCHDGEVHANRISPSRCNDFNDFDQKLRGKQVDPAARLSPGTLEGCVVRMADTVAYIGRDIEDAIILGLIKRDNIPQDCKDILGSTNGTIVYTLVTDLIEHSDITADRPYIGFSDRVGNSLERLKRFNYDHIYFHPATKDKLPIIKECYRSLFNHYLDTLQSGRDRHPEQVDLMTDMAHSYLEDVDPATMVCDFIAGMTDDFFLKQARAIGCRTPEKT